MKGWDRFIERVEHLVGRTLEGFEIVVALAAFDDGVTASDHALQLQAKAGA